MVDDQLPCRGKDQPIFAAARNGDFWVAVVEKAASNQAIKLQCGFRIVRKRLMPEQRESRGRDKEAFAKLNGSYRAISSGSQPDALFCLTGILMPRTLQLGINGTVWGWFGVWGLGFRV